MALKGLSKGGIEVILKERLENGNYLSLEEFAKRVRLSRDDIAALVPSGVFDSISSGKPRVLQARALLILSNNLYRTHNEQEDLFSAEVQPSYLKINNGTAMLAPTQPISLKARKTFENELWEEYKSLGFLRRLHPLALWKDKVLTVKRIKARHIEEYTGRHVTLVGWPVTQKEVWTKDGLTMSFLTFEDETALYETVIFPQVYERYSSLLFDQLPLLVYGKACEDWGALSIEVEIVERLE